MTAEVSVRDDILAAAARALERAHFSVQIESVDGATSPFSWLVAENELFALGAIAGETLGELEQYEADATEALLARAGGEAGGVKQWDLYLALLTTQPWRTLDPRGRVELVYNTRGIRRLIGAGLIPDEAGDLDVAIEAVLRPFLPLGEPLGTTLTDLDDSLVNALVINGVELADAERFVVAYRTHESLDDV